MTPTHKQLLTGVMKPTEMVCMKYMRKLQSKYHIKRLDNVILVPVALLVKDNLNARSIFKSRALYFITMHKQRNNPEKCNELGKESSKRLKPSIEICDIVIGFVLFHQKRVSYSLSKI